MMEFLRPKCCKFEKLQFEALWILTNIAAGSEDYATEEDTAEFTYYRWFKCQ